MFCRRCCLLARSSERLLIVCRLCRLALSAGRPHHRPDIHFPRPVILTTPAPEQHHYARQSNLGVIHEGEMGPARDFLLPGRNFLPKSANFSPKEFPLSGN